MVPQPVPLGAPASVHRQFVGDQKLTGVVRFSGATKFAEGDWLGIECPGCSREVGFLGWGFIGMNSPK